MIYVGFWFGFVFCLVLEGFEFVGLVSGLGLVWVLVLFFRGFSFYFCRGVAG